MITSPRAQCRPYSPRVQQRCQPGAARTVRHNPLSPARTTPNDRLRASLHRDVQGGPDPEALQLHHPGRAQPILTVKEEAVDVNPAASPPQAALRRIDQVLSDYKATDWRNDYRRRQLRVELAELTGDSEEPVRAARRLIREDRKARARRRRSVSQARRARAQNAQWSAPNGLARPRQPDAYRVVGVIPTPVETDRGRH
jgi:hypothetical protein